jgi:hypothetical protein
VVQCGGAFGFALKSHQVFGVVGSAGSNQFEGHVPVEAGLVSFVDIGHAALAERLDDFVFAKSFADHGAAFPSLMGGTQVKYSKS